MKHPSLTPAYLRRQAASRAWLCPNHAAALADKIEMLTKAAQSAYDYLGDNSDRGRVDVVLDLEAALTGRGGA